MDSLGDILKKLRHWVRPWEMGTEPMEVRRAILDEVAGKVVSAGGGKRIFPYNRLRIRLLVSSPEERDQLDAIVREGWNLEEEIRDRVHDQGSDVPPGFGVEVQITDQEPGPEFGGRRFHIAYERAEAVAVRATAEAARRPVLELTVTKGKATQQVYMFSRRRMPEVQEGETLFVYGISLRREKRECPEGRIRRPVQRTLKAATQASGRVLRSFGEGFDQRPRPSADRPPCRRCIVWIMESPPGIDFEETKRILAALEREDVRYVLIGAMAMAAQGLVRATHDLDFFVAPPDLRRDPPHAVSNETGHRPSPGQVGR